MIDTQDENEGNVCTKSQVAIVKEKGWTVYDYNGIYYNSQEYEGSDEPTNIGASLNDNEQMINDSWFSVDGKKFSGEPKKKGIYVRNGKKVFK